jgi:RNA polymerase sigma-70 factor (ECF subfamily)
VILLQKGDANAFKTLIEQYQSKVMNTALSMVQDHGAAEDITQEVFVTVYKTILSFQGNSSLSTWIYRITVNKCVDHIRTVQNRRRLGFLGLFSGKGYENLDPPDFFHPGITTENKEKSQYLFQAIYKLPEQQKTAFILAFIEELPQKDIAEIMGLSLKALESLLQRAKQKLRTELEHIYDRRKSNH